MTRNGDCDPVRGASIRHRPRRLRPPDALRHLPIRPRLASRNGLQILPNQPLERRRLNVEGQIQARPRAAEIRRDLRGPGRQRLGIKTLNQRLREFVREQPLRIGAKLNGADAALAGREQHGSNCRLRRGKPNVDARASPPVCPWGHPKLAVGPFIEAARGSISGLDHRSRNRLAVRS